MPISTQALIRNAPLLGGAVLGGVYGARQGFAPTSTHDDLESRGARAVVGGVGLGLAGGAAGVLLAKHSPKVPGMVAPAFRRATAMVESASLAVKARAAAFEAGGMGGMEALARSVAKSPLFMGAAGAGIGAAIGSHYGHPGTGAVVGTGVGMGAVLATKLSSHKFLTSKTGIFGGVMALSAMLLVGGEMAKAPEVEGTMYGVPESDGTYSYSGVPSSGVRQRLDSMNAHGRIALGLHNFRHG